MSSSGGDDNWGSPEGEWTPASGAGTPDPDHWGAEPSHRSPLGAWNALSHSQHMVGMIAAAAVLVVLVAGVAAPRLSHAIFKQRVTPTELCLTAGVVYVSLGAGLLASEAALDIAADQADLLNSRVSGDQQLDEAAHRLADSALDVNRGVRAAAEEGVSLDPLVWERQITLVGEPLRRAQNAASTVNDRCGQLTELSLSTQ